MYTIFPEVLSLDSALKTTKWFQIPIMVCNSVPINEKTKPHECA